MRWRIRWPKRRMPEIKAVDGPALLNGSHWEIQASWTICLCDLAELIIRSNMISNFLGQSHGEVTRIPEFFRSSEMWKVISSCSGVDKSPSLG